MSQQPDILDRLRDAKPASHELAEEAELWAKITATAPDPRVERQPKRQARARHALRVIPALLAVALAVGIALAGLVLLRHGSAHPSRPASGDAHRGEIVDRNGTVLADTVRVATVRVRPSALPSSPSGRLRVYESLARALSIDGASRRCVVGGQEWLGQAPCWTSPEPPASHAALVTVARGVPSARVKRLQAAHLRGVSVAWRWVFTHPGNLAAQAVGLVAPTVSAGGGVGQSGLEATYDRDLRAGDNLSTSLNAGLQRAGEAALRTSLERNHAPGGSFVAMNPATGEVYAMGSLPTYDGSIFSQLSSPSQIRRLSAGSSSLVNRATQSAGPTGSLFTPITAVAALSSGSWTTASTFDDTGQYCVGGGLAQQCRQNAGHAVDGSLDVVNALRVSSDDFFYNLGARLNADPGAHPDGGALGQWASSFGIGRRTDVDLPGEASGTLPTPAWRQQRNTLESECDNATGPFAFTNGRGVSAHEHPGWHRSPKHAPGGCAIADGTDRPWSIGDNESLAVGQGDIQATPLQVAVAYAALANGGTIVRPHLAAELKSPNGTTTRRITPQPTRYLGIAAANLTAIRQGLHEAAQSPGGTSDDVMGTFPMTVYGKAGSAQYPNQPDYAWYAAFVTDHTDKPIVVVVHIEKAGFGDVAAAPVARQILSQWFFGKLGNYTAGTSTST